VLYIPYQSLPYNGVFTLSIETVLPVDIDTGRVSADALFLAPVMIFTRGVSLTNFVIASSALGFQVLVLYPWHKRLDDDFEELKKEHLLVLRQGEKDRLGELKSIREQLDGLHKSRWI